MVVLGSAVVWVLFSLAALFYALVERREAKLDREAIPPPYDPALIEAAGQAIRNAGYHLAIQTIFLCVGVLSIVWLPLSARFDFLERGYSDEYRLVVRVFLISGQALLVAKLRSQRRFRRRVLYGKGD